MRFPPPIRLLAPLLALAFGLLATWFEYRLNLGLDLQRQFNELRERADINGQRLARRSERRLAAGQRAALQTEIDAAASVPHVIFVALIDETGLILTDQSRKLRGRPAVSVAEMAPALALVNRTGRPVVELSPDSARVYSAHPFREGGRLQGWALAGYERKAAFTAAGDDAGRQLGWMVGAMTLLGLALWAVLHFTFAARLARLAASIRAFGEGEKRLSPLPAGGDEVGELSTAFSAMAARLEERAAEQLRLEREVLESTENERRRIGHDLHDGLGQRLTAASMAASALTTALQGSAPALASRSEEIARQLREAIAEARSLSHGLAPVTLTGDGLSASLRELTEAATRGGVRGIFECPEPVRIADAEVAVQFYRVAQEAMNNALKHSGASEIRVGLERRDGRLVLEVDDDGSGIEPDFATDRGIGLKVMRYRARLIGAELNVTPAPAGGTRVAMTAPSTA